MTTDKPAPLSDEEMVEWKHTATTSEARLLATIEARDKRIEELEAEAVNNLRNEEKAMNALDLMTVLADEFEKERDEARKRIEELEAALKEKP
jgi:hypothetical protein